MEQSPAKPAGRPQSYWWLASLAAPVFGLSVDALATLLRATENLGWMALGLGALFGLTTCLHSFKRRERLALVSLVSGIPCALVLCGILLLLVSSLFYGTGAHSF